VEHGTNGPSMKVPVSQSLHSVENLSAGNNALEIDDVVKGVTERFVRLKRLHKAGEPSKRESAAVKLHEQSGPPPSFTVAGDHNPHSLQPNNKLPRRRTAFSRFIDQEAALSGDDSGDEVDSDDLDGFESDFIDDRTQGSPQATSAEGDTPASHGPLYRHMTIDSPSPGSLLRRLQRAKLGRHGALIGNAVRSNGNQQKPKPCEGNSGLGSAPLITPYHGRPRAASESEDDYDMEDSFIDDNADDGDGGTWDTPVGKLTADDACAVCSGVEGELLCCDGCPSVYHLHCAGLNAVPEGNAHPYLNSTPLVLLLLVSLIEASFGGK